MDNTDGDVKFETPPTPDVVKEIAWDVLEKYYATILPDKRIVNGKMRLEMQHKSILDIEEILKKEKLDGTGHIIDSFLTLFEGPMLVSNKQYHLAKNDFYDFLTSQEQIFRAVAGFDRLLKYVKKLKVH